MSSPDATASNYEYDRPLFAVRPPGKRFWCLFPTKRAAAGIETHRRAEFVDQEIASVIRIPTSRKLYANAWMTWGVMMSAARLLEEPETLVEVAVGQHDVPREPICTLVGARLVGDIDADVLDGPDITTTTARIRFTAPSGKVGKNTLGPAPWQVWS